MGLFGFLGKAIGKVAKVGLSAVTHGVSDKVLGVAGSVLHKQRRVSMPLTAQNAAALLKSNPRTISTTSYMRGTPGMTGSRPRRKKRSRSRSKARTKRTLAPTPARPSRTRQKRTKRSSSSPRKLPAALNAQAQKTKQLAADWRALGGRAGTGQTFFEWKRGR